MNQRILDSIVIESTRYSSPKPINLPIELVSILVVTSSVQDAEDTIVKALLVSNTI